MCRVYIWYSAGPSFPNYFSVLLPSFFSFVWNFSKRLLFFFLTIFNRSEFPSLSSQSRSSITKDQAPLNRQKSQASKLPLSTAPTANLIGKGKTEAANKQTGKLVGLCSYVSQVALLLCLSNTLMLQRQWTSGIGVTASGPGSPEPMVLILTMVVVA
jgi:hypothetical protein